MPDHRVDVPHLRPKASEGFGRRRLDYARAAEPTRQARKRRQRRLVSHRGSARTRFLLLLIHGGWRAHDRSEKDFFHQTGRNVSRQHVLWSMGKAVYEANKPVPHGGFISTGINRTCSTRCAACSLHASGVRFGQHKISRLLSAAWRRRRGFRMRYSGARSFIIDNLLASNKVKPMITS